MRWVARRFAFSPHSRCRLACRCLRFEARSPDHTAIGRSCRAHAPRHLPDIFPLPHPTKVGHDIGPVPPVRCWRKGKPMRPTAAPPRRTRRPKGGDASCRESAPWGGALPRGPHPSLGGSEPGRNSMGYRVTCESTASRKGVRARACCLMCSGTKRHPKSLLSHGGRAPFA